MIKRPFPSRLCRLWRFTILAVLTLLFGDLIESTYVNPVVLGRGSFHRSGTAISKRLEMDKKALKN